MTGSRFEKLVELAKILRSDKGCPWDRKQTIKSSEEHILEEVGEIQEAIKKNDWENLKEELGDVLFSLVMLMNIAEEQNLFLIADVLDDIEKKIVRRHTWVFGDDKAETAEEALALWRKNKREEKCPDSVKSA